jgi:hypothetical protein
MRKGQFFEGTDSTATDQTPELRPLYLCATVRHHFAARNQQRRNEHEFVPLPSFVSPESRTSHQRLCRRESTSQSRPKSPELLLEVVLAAKLPLVHPSLVSGKTTAGWVSTGMGAQTVMTVDSVRSRWARSHDESTPWQMGYETVTKISSAEASRSRSLMRLVVEFRVETKIIAAPNVSRTTSEPMNGDTSAKIPTGSWFALLL